MDVKLKYVTERRSKSGAVRWYWQRKGHPLTRLPDDPVKRFAVASQLNAAADAKARQTIPDGSIAWVIEKYKASDAYASLAPGTLKYYNRFLYEIEALGPALSFSSLDRKMVIDFIETYSGSQPRQVAAILKNLFNTALYYGYASANLAMDLRLSSPQHRSQVWTARDEKAWLDAAAYHHNGKLMALAFTILVNTAQRPGDVLAMTWNQYNGDTITLRQQKTGQLIEVPCTAELRTTLDEKRKTTSSVLIVSNGRRPLSYTAFNRAFSQIAESAGLQGLQARDLRRTACLRMAKGGATEVQIANVSGHTIEHTRQILETYLPRDVELARAGIAILETSRERKV